MNTTHVLLLAVYLIQGTNSRYQYDLFRSLGIDPRNPVNFTGLLSEKSSRSIERPSVKFTSSVENVAVKPKQTDEQTDGQNNDFGYIMHALQSYDDITYATKVKMGSFDVQKGSQQITLVSFSTHSKGVGEKIVLEVVLHFEFSNFLGEGLGGRASKFQDFSQTICINKRDNNGDVIENRFTLPKSQYLKLAEWATIMVRFRKNRGATVFIAPDETKICSALEPQQLRGIPFHGNPCGINYDIQFILDSSGSLRDYWVTEKQFLKKLARALGVGSGNRAGVITFSYNAEESIKMSDSLDLDRFETLVDGIQLMNYTTRMDKALQLASNVIFNTKHGARTDFPKLLIFLTDGKQDTRGGKNLQDPGVIAKKLHEKKVKVFTIGIGDEVDFSELHSISGDPGRVYQAQTFNDLFVRNFAEQVTSKVCTKSTLPLRGITRLGQRGETVGSYEVLVNKFLGNMQQPQFLVGSNAFDLLNPCTGILKYRGVPVNPKKDNYGPRTWGKIKQMIAETSNRAPSFKPCIVEAFGVRTKIYSGDSVNPDECSDRGCYSGCRKYSCYNGLVKSEYTCVSKCKRHGQSRLSNEEWFERSKSGKECVKFRCLGRRVRRMKFRTHCSVVDKKLGCYCADGYVMSGQGQCQKLQVLRQYLRVQDGWCEHHFAPHYFKRKAIQTK